MKLVPLCKALVADQRGGVAVLMAFALSILIGFLGLAIDVAIWQTDQRSLQGTADLAAVAAYTAYANNGAGGNFATSTPAIAAATKVALDSGYSASAITVAAYSDASKCASNNCLSVTLTKPEKRFFTAIFLPSNFTETATAVSTIGGAANACVMALDPTGNGVITASGNPTLSLNDCNLYNNSTSTAATVLNGGASIQGCTTTNSCGSQAFLAQPDNPGSVDVPVNTNAIVAPDPYADVTPPSVGGCTATFPPNPVPSGTYCPGNITGQQSITFATGSVIVFSQGLDLKAGATIGCGGCTVYVTGNDSKIDGGSNINIQAQSTGTYAGIALWFGGNYSVTYNGNNGSSFMGAIYAPATTVSFGGTNVTGGSNCVRLIAGGIQLTGNTVDTFSNSGCPASTPLGPVANLQGTLVK